MRFGRRDVRITISFIRILYRLNMAERGLMGSWNIEHVNNAIEVTVD